MIADRSARITDQLATAPGSLIKHHDLAIVDLDGVVYVGRDAVDHAVDSLGRVRTAGARIAYVTNNASRPPARVAEHLVGLGIETDTGDVVTSAQAAARLVAESVPAKASVLVVGGQGLVEALAEHGLVAVDSAADSPQAVLQGFDRSVGWPLLAEGTYAIADGVPWFASNTDLTVPTPRGFAPGNGALVAAIAAATGKHPTVAGKPEPALFHETQVRVGGRTPIVIGDRLDTDIAGANNAGCDSLLVLTGVSDLAAVMGAAPALRPTYVAPDLRALFREHPEVVRDDDTFVCGGARIRPEGNGFAHTLESVADADGYDQAVALLRATVTAAWQLDDGAERDASAVAATVATLMR